MANNNNTPRTHAKHQKKQTVITCRECGIKFLRMPGGSTKYCSDGCKPLSRRSWWKQTNTLCFCYECGKPYTPKTSHAQNKYCGVLCRRGAMERTRRHKQECDYCGVEFMAHRKSPGIYCSSLCQGKAKTQKRRLKNAGVFSPIEWRGCYVCGDELGPRPGAASFCQSCKDALGTAATTNYPAGFLLDRMFGRDCVVCGRSFTPFSQASVTCSRSCYRKTPENRYAKAEWKKSPAGKREKRIQNRARRARRYGNGPVDNIDPIDVFNRDSWRCRVCGVYTPKSLRGTHDDRAPELDHIIPLAAGGTHTHDNVQCSCRACNGEKGATIYQQDFFIGDQPDAEGG